MLSNLLHSKWIPFCLLALIIFGVLGRTIWFNYVNLDEGVLIVNSQLFISKISNLSEVFKHDINYPSAVAPYYRPIFITSLVLNSQMGSNPWVYHLGNILIHLISVILIFLLFGELGFKKNISILSSVIFAIHPAVVPVVAWVPGRIEALLTVFAVASFILFIKFIMSGKWLYLAFYFVTFGLGLFTKEVIISLLAVLLFYYLIRRREIAGGSSEIIVWLLGSAAIIAGWFFVRKAVLSSILKGDLSFAEMLSVAGGNIMAVFLYLGKIILPFNLTPVPIMADSVLWFGFVALAILIIYFVFGRVKFFSLGGLGLLWFVVFLTPSLVSYFQPGSMVFFEHRLYLPMLGIFIFLMSSDLASQLDFKKIKNILPLAGIIGVLLFLNWNYSGVYKNKFTFWQRAVADSPQSAQTHGNLANSYLADGKVEEAMAEFAKTLEINPREKRIHLILGLYYLDQGQYEKGKKELEQEIKIDPNQFVAYHSLGRLYAQGKNLKEAERYFLKTLEINPNYVLAHQDLVVLYFSQNKHPQAIAQLKELLKLQRPEAMHPQIQKIIETYAKEAVLRQ